MFLSSLTKISYSTSTSESVASTSISKWAVELELENFGGVNYIKKNLKLGLSLNEISEECKIPVPTLSKYLKEHA